MFPKKCPKKTFSPASFSQTQYNNNRNKKMPKLVVTYASAAFSIPGLPVRIT